MNSSAGFPTTHWTLVSAVQGEDAGEAARAMEELCRSYWYPIYAFLRRSGHSAADAEDFTQAFFHRLITEDAILSARREAGRLRSWLLGVLKRLLSDHTRHFETQKRGGGQVIVSFDEMDAEERFAREPVDAQDPEQIFTLAWARQVFTGVQAKLRASYETTGRAGVFEMLVPFVTCEAEPPSHRELARQLGSSEAASRILIHRLRVKFRDLLSDEVALTVLTPAEIPGELAWLRGVLSAG